MKIGPEQSKDTGMAMVLICLLLGYFKGSENFYLSAIILLLIDMIRPQIFKPLAVVWFGLSHILGTVMSKVILTLLFFVLVTPVGLFRRAIGADSLQLKKWKKGTGSVFKVRDYTFHSDDIEKPY